MTYELRYRNTVFNVHVERCGGAVSIFKNGDYYWRGQWFHNRKKLMLDRFPFVEIHHKIERMLQNNLNEEDVIFPYIPGYSKCT